MEQRTKQSTPHGAYILAFLAFFSFPSVPAGPTPRMPCFRLLPPILPLHTKPKFHSLPPQCPAMAMSFKAVVLPSAGKIKPRRQKLGEWLPLVGRLEGALGEISG